MTEVYPRIAISAFVQLLAVLIGFGLASAWEERRGELEATRIQLSLLDPLADEVAALSTKAVQLLNDLEAPCRIEGFKIDRFVRLSEGEHAFALGSFYYQVEAVYNDLKATSGPTSLVWGQPKRCRELARLQMEFDSLKSTMAVRIANLNRKHTLLIARGEREDELADTRRQWTILRAVDAEVQGLALHARELSGKSPCRVEGFKTATWHGILPEERLLLQETSVKIQGVYDAIPAAANTLGDRPEDTRCREELGRLADHFHKARIELIQPRMRELGNREKVLLDSASSGFPIFVAQVRESGWLEFIVKATVWMVMALVAVPAAMYGALYGLTLIPARRPRRIPPESGEITEAAGSATIDDSRGTRAP